MWENGAGPRTSGKEIGLARSLSQDEIKSGAEMRVRTRGVIKSLRTFLLTPLSSSFSSFSHLHRCQIPKLLGLFCFKNEEKRNSATRRSCCSYSPNRRSGTHTQSHKPHRQKFDISTAEMGRQAKKFFSLARSHVQGELHLQPLFAGNVFHSLLDWNHLVCCSERLTGSGRVLWDSARLLLISEGCRCRMQVLKL